MAIEYDIRLIRANETAILREMLYLAVFVPPGELAPDPSILKEAKLAAIYENWGRPGDLALVGVADLRTRAAGDNSHAPGGSAHRGHQSIIGAAWYRLFPVDAPGYGYVSDDIPELAVAVVPECRAMGVGTALLRALVSRAMEAGYRGVSLSVDRRNPALRLYERLGFAAVESSESDGSPTMLLEFSG